jgi:2-dehydro-3-deoxygluconokinase
VVTFGELLLRLDAPGHERLLQTDRYRASFTGGEANAAVALAQWGIETRAVSKVPEHEIGQAAINHLRRYGVRTEAIARGGPRLGILYVETGASQRAGKVIYDRLHTSFRQVEREEFDWPSILSGAGWLHLTGTAPAGGEAVGAVLADALAAARSLGVRVSLDCSFRSALWTREEASAVLTPLLAQVDLLLGSEADARGLFGVEASGEESLAALAEKFNLRWVAYTERDSHSASENTIRAMFYDGHQVAHSRSYTIEIVDRIGGGDAFAAGILFGLLCGWPSQRIVEYAAAAACLKHTIPWDFNLASRDEVERLASGESTGRLVR